MIAKGRDTPSKIQNQSRAKYEISSAYRSPTGPKNAIIIPAYVLLEGPTHSIAVKKGIPFIIKLTEQKTISVFHLSFIYKNKYYFSVLFN